jgi:hypothetical protein
MNLDKFDKSIEAELLKNDFAFYDDWKYGPESGWFNDNGFFTLKLMGHDYGYWLIIETSGGGERKGINIGSSNNAKDIVSVRDAFKKLW